MKSLTGSSQVIEILLGRYGPCTNYHMVQDLETKLTCSVVDEG